MGHSIGHAITGSVPTPDRSIVHPQRGKLRCLATGQDLKWILVRLGDHDWTKTRDLIVKQFDDRVLQPVIAKTHARLLTPRKLRTRTLIGRMLEECDTCLVPEPMTKQQRRVNSNCQHGSSDRLRHVVVIDELIGTGLKMDLETGVARFHHYVVLRDMKFMDSFNVNREWATSHTDDASIEFVIPGTGSEIRQGQVRLPQRRENSGEQDIGIKFLCAFPGEVDQLL